MDNVNDNELKFVVEKYKQGRLNTDKAWTKLTEQTGTDQRGKHWRKYAVAASISLFFGVAFACIMIPKERTGIEPKNEDRTATEHHTKAVASNMPFKVKVFSFDNTPINIALKEISQYYGCKLSCSDSTKCVSGEIETQSVDDAVNILEATLSIKITRK